MFADMEMIMQYVWKHRLWPTAGLTTVDGRSLKIIDPGQINNGAGPDFFNAKIEIDGNVWAGNIEIHDRASDWMRHGHHKDPAYDTVILHVVNRDDTQVRRSSGETIPQVVMPNAQRIRERCLLLKGAPPSELPCEDTIRNLHPIYITDWLTALGFERLYRKSDHLIELAERYKGDWEEVAYITLARAMGFGTNNDAFERLAISLPVKLLRKHSDNLESVEAMLFGQAALIDPLDPDDPYPQRLNAEYSFLSHKYSLQPIGREAWKLGRMRPWNFPHRRIATLARFIVDHPGLMAALTDVADIDDAKSLFDFQLEGYWRNHHRFGATNPETERAISLASCRLLMINVIVPLIHAHATVIGDDRAADRAAEILQDLEPEDNAIVAMFKRCGVKCPDAFSSQALIQLRREYCEPRKCMYCRIGHHLLTASLK